jgi:hypothetical protein
MKPELNPPPPQARDTRAVEPLRALIAEWLKIADGFGRAPQGRTAFSRCAHDLEAALAAVQAQPASPDKGTCSLKPCGAFVESSIPEYCRTCNWSFESHRQPASAPQDDEVDRLLREDGRMVRWQQPREALTRCDCRCHAEHSAHPKAMEGCDCGCCTHPDDPRPQPASAPDVTLLDRLHELETKCILVSEHATDQGQMQAWHERAECAYRAREALSRQPAPAASVPLSVIARETVDQIINPFGHVGKQEADRIVLAALQRAREAGGEKP